MSNIILLPSGADNGQPISIELPKENEKYYWIITADIVSPEDIRDTLGAIGNCGPTNLHRLACFNRKGDIPMTYFRLLDDDGAVYYYGMLYGEFGGLEPLDDFGMPNAGCTSIQHLTPDGWVTI